MPRVDGFLEVNNLGARQSTQFLIVDKVELLPRLLGTEPSPSVVHDSSLAKTQDVSGLELVLS